MAFRHILLWRHADALAIGQHIDSDINRPLSKKGIKQANVVAKWLTQHMPKKTLIISSSALRATQTAQKLSNDFVVYNSLDPGASLADIVKTVNELTPRDAEETGLLIIGHQPWLGEYASYLLHVSEPMHAVNIKKGALWWFKKPTIAENASFDLFCIQTHQLL